MGTRSRVRRGVDILHVFDKPRATFDDYENESETSDYVERQSDSESAQDVSSENEAMEVEEEKNANYALTKRSAGISEQSKSYLQSTSGFVWSTKPPDSPKRQRDSQQIYTPSPQGLALEAKAPLEAWSVLFTDEILNLIVTHTNEEIARTIAELRDKGRYQATYHKPTDLIELKAMIGLLYFAGLQKVNHTKLKNLWSPFGISLFRLTMPESRFSFLLDVLRFDDKTTRAKRKAQDRFANIREIWNMFISNCTANYTLHTNCTIGKQLLSFGGKCLFRVSLPSKPDRYLKVVTLNDAVTHYMYNAIPYVGVVEKEPDEAEVPDEVPSYYIKKLCEPIYHTERTITCNNWFSSIPIFDKMLNEFNLSMVGAIRKNKREIPQSFKKLSPKGVKMKFAYHDKKTLISFAVKQNQIILLLSTLQQTGRKNEASGESEIVTFYNATKGGTDSFDKKCYDYTTARRTCRWPLRIFYGMLDQANVNSLILYNLCLNNCVLMREQFIFELSFALIKPLLIRRLSCTTLRTTLRMQIESLIDCKDIPEDQDPRDILAENKMSKCKRCGFCPYMLDRKTSYKCLRCERPMCREHVAKICIECSVELNNK